MLGRVEGKKNGYIITETTNSDDIHEINESYEHIRVMICNSKTAKAFRRPFYNTLPITINNKIPDRVFYINSVT